MRSKPTAIGPAHTSELLRKERTKNVVQVTKCGWSIQLKARPEQYDARDQKLIGIARLRSTLDRKSTENQRKLNQEKQNSVDVACTHLSSALYLLVFCGCFADDAQLSSPPHKLARIAQQSQRRPVFDAAQLLEQRRLRRRLRRRRGQGP